MTFEIPDWVTFPEDDWGQITTEEAGLDPEEFEAFLSGLEIRGASHGGEGPRRQQIRRGDSTWWLPDPCLGRSALNDR